MERRDWIKTIGLGSLAVVPTRLLGDADLAFDKVMTELVGSSDIKLDRRVELLVQTNAANGAVVPVGVVSSVPDTKKIVLLVNNHSKAKVAEIDTSNAMLEPHLSTHLQLQNPATITALVETSMGWFGNTANIESLGESCES